MSIRRLIIALTFLSIFSMAARGSLDSDTWWHLRTGQSILETREVPKVDSFSHTQDGEPWTYPSAAWLSEAGLFWLFERFGPGALNVWVAALVTATFAVVYLSLSGGPFLRAFILILAAAASSVFWAARPFMVSFLFAAIYLLVLEGFRWRQKQRLYLLPSIMLFWVNSHPGFAIGFLLLLVYVVDSLATKLSENAHKSERVSLARIFLGSREGSGYLFRTGLFMLVAASINPAGPAILRYPFDTLSIGILRDFIQEWQSPNFHNVDMLPFLLLLVISMAVLGASKRKIALSDLLLLTGFAAMSLLASRNVAMFALVAPIVLTRHLRPLFSEWAQKFNIRLRTSSVPNCGQSLLNGAFLLLLVAASLFRVSLILPAQENEKIYAGEVPVAAVEYLKEERPAGNMLNSYNWGGYLVWALPEYPVFVDGRTDLYDDEVLMEWLEIVSAENGWQDKLAQRNVRLILLEPDWPLVSQLDEAGWQLHYQNEQSVIYQKE
jgi:hypothetical protein